MSPDGRWLAAVSANRLGDGAIRLWDLNRERKDYDTAADVVLKIAADETKDEQARAQTLSFGADGTLAAGCSDGRVAVWTPGFVKDAAPAWEAAATGSAITALGFENSGKRLWSGDARGILKQRATATGDLLSTLRLLPAPQPAAAAAWVKWDKAGTIEKSAP